MKRSIIIRLGAALLLALGGYAQKDNSAEVSDGQKTIGVLQFVQHNSLDAAYKGLKEGLAEEGYREGGNLTIDHQNVQNNQDNLKSMSEKLVKEDPDLLLGIATPVTQSLLNETATIPMTATTVTDLERAHLVTSSEKPDGNVTDTIDMVLIEKQIGLLLDIVPDAKTISIMYNNGEANSKIQADLAEKGLKKAGVKVKVLTTNSTSDVQQVTKSLAKDVDGTYIPTDNTFASAVSVVGEAAKETKTPVVAGAVDQVKDGGLATVGIDYKSLDKQTGIMAAKILDSKSPSELPVETANDLEPYINKDMAKALGISPDSIKEAG